MPPAAAAVISIYLQQAAGAAFRMTMSEHADHARGGGRLSEAAIHESEAALTAVSCSTERELRVPCYCEENVWRLAYRRIYGRRETDERLYVVFVSNEERCCPMFSQLAQDDPDEPCFWDYHVLLIGSSSSAVEANGADKCPVWDVDSRLPYPTPVSVYLTTVFREECFREEYRTRLAPRFRVIRAEHYLQYFFSDRKHMIDPEKGEWRATPPDYECIGVTSGKQSNLDDYIDTTSAGGGDEEASMGIVSSLDEFRRRFCS